MDLILLVLRFCLPFLFVLNFSLLFYVTQFRGLRSFHLVTIQKSIALEWHDFAAHVM